MVMHDPERSDVDYSISANLIVWGYVKLVGRLRPAPVKSRSNTPVKFCPDRGPPCQIFTPVGPPDL